MAARKAISKKIRFEIFKRDKFTCQYCGKSAPDVILEIDHIQPISKNGDDDILNYVTACKDCNAGKSNRELSDDSVIQKRKAQLDELQARREQLKLMLEWQHSLETLEEEKVEELAKYWNEFITPFTLNDKGKEYIRKALKKYEVAEVLEAMRSSAKQYLKRDPDGDLVTETNSKALDYIARICACQRRQAGKPYLKDLYYIRGILRNRMSYCNDWMSISLLEKAYKNGYDLDDLKQLAIEARNWTEWRTTIESWTATE